MRLIAGIDPGGTAIHFTVCDEDGRFLRDTLCEYPARVPAARRWRRFDASEKRERPR